MIHIVDYGLGNVQAFANMYKRLGIEAKLVSNADDLADAKGIILPGVGAFDRAMMLLSNSGMRPKLTELVLEKALPVIGICVGMQMLANGSDEGGLDGLGWVAGQVRSFASDPALLNMPQPHMGWNDVRAVKSSPLLKGLETEARFYFLHSYYFDNSDSETTLATTNYGKDFSCIVSQNNVYGVQCHPEKSHHWGAQLLKNFAELSGC